HPALRATLSPLRGARDVLAIVFAIASVVAGWIAIHAQFTYRGNALSEADVPLVQKESVVGAIANGGARYDLVGGWTWLRPHPWYPGVYTVGRAFDYELLRRYGVRNTGGKPRYVVSYAFEPPP